MHSKAEKATVSVPMGNWSAWREVSYIVIIRQQSSPSLTADPNIDPMGNEYDYKCRGFELKALSRSEFEAVKRFGDYEELHDGTLMRVGWQWNGYLRLRREQWSCGRRPD
jgi:hypothetical protein